MVMSPFIELPGHYQMWSLKSLKTIHPHIQAPLHLRNPGGDKENNFPKVIQSVCQQNCC